MGRRLRTQLLAPAFGEEPESPWLAKPLQRTAGLIVARHGHEESYREHRGHARRAGPRRTGACVRRRPGRARRLRRSAPASPPLWNPLWARRASACGNGRSTSVGIGKDPIGIGKDPIGIGKDPIGIGKDPIGIGKDHFFIRKDRIRIGKDHFSFARIRSGSARIRSGSARIIFPSARIRSGSARIRSGSARIIFHRQGSTPHRQGSDPDRQGSFSHRVAPPRSCGQPRRDRLRSPRAPLVKAPGAARPAGRPGPHSSGNEVR